MPTAIAPDDIVATHEQGRANARPPLLVTEPLIAYLDAHGLGAGDVQPTPVGDGHSNVTYRIERDGLTAILRRPPRPPVPPSAHDVLREARLLSALEHTDARVPAVLAACDDDTVIGAPFYVMELIDGVVITDALPGALDTESERRQVGEELVDALVEVHAVDWAAAGLEGFGKPTGYLERQLRRFGGLWEINRTREVPEVERVGAWLAAHLPQSPKATIVHGDYRIGNMIYAAQAPASLSAILDWEMATIGDPLADVGYMCMLWTEAGDPPSAFELSSVTRQPGFPTRAELVERYLARTGRDISEQDMRWYTVLAIWKSVVFMEGNYKWDPLESTCRHASLSIL